MLQTMMAKGGICLHLLKKYMEKSENVKKNWKIYLQNKLL